jgi:hypothetical protein
MRAPALLLLAALSVACGKPPVDLAKALTIVDLSTGWQDGGIVNGQNKLVPTVSLRLKNGSDRVLVSLQVNTVFRRVTEKEEWGSAFMTAAGSDGLQPGATTKALALTSPLGYTGTETRVDILKNSHFVDAKVEVFAKYASTQWMGLGEFPIARELVTK